MSQYSRSKAECILIQQTNGASRTTSEAKIKDLEPRGATTAEKLRGTKVWVSTPGRLPKAGLCVGCGRGSPPPAVRVRGYHPRKICENSDAKSCILVTTCCEISWFLKTTAKKLEGTNTVVVPMLEPNTKAEDPSLLSSRRLELKDMVSKTPTLIIKIESSKFLHTVVAGSCILADDSCTADNENH